jgi:DNA-binding HxlR family transcriptional regulator
MAGTRTCPIDETINLIAHKWKVLILRSLLQNGTMRFSELSRGIDGVSQKMLTQHLRQMEADGLVERKVYPKIPPKVEYSLTPLGKSLKTVLDSMTLWGGEYLKSRNEEALMRDKLLIEGL